MTRKPEQPKAGCWVLTREHNDHDQHGEYFEAVWASKPTIGQLALYFQNSGYHSKHTDVMQALAFLTNLVDNGGGRRGVEDVWYNLEFKEFQQ